MYGVLTSSPELARAGIGDVAHYDAEDVSGRRRDPLDGATNAVACWGDTEAVSADPARAAVAADGTRATPDAPGHHWGTVCPTDPDYRAALLDRIEAVGGAGDVRLTTVGFPGAAFCGCDRCERRFEASDRDDREAWRADVITEFVAGASARVAGDLTVTLYPDPYPGNLRERTGLDPGALDPYADEFLVPLCGVSYDTTYWVESLARGFAAELGDLDASLALQLSAAGAGADRLLDLTRQVDPHADAVVYGTHRGDADVVREVVRRRRADGESARPAR